MRLRVVKLVRQDFAHHYALIDKQIISCQYLLLMEFLQSFNRGFTELDLNPTWSVFFLCQVVESLVMISLPNQSQKNTSQTNTIMRESLNTMHEWPVPYLARHFQIVPPETLYHVWGRPRNISQTIYVPKHAIPKILIIWRVVVYSIVQPLISRTYKNMFCLIGHYFVGPKSSL